MSNRRGIALIEVLVSIVIIGAGLITIIHALDTSTRQAGRIQTAGQAEALLHEAVIDATKIQPLQPNGSRSGRFDEPFETYQWEAKSEAIRDTPFAKVTVTVRWRDGARERSVQAERVVAQ